MPNRRRKTKSRLGGIGVLILMALTGALCGFRCRCNLSKGKIREIYTVAWLKLPEKKPGPRVRVYSPLRRRFRVAVVHEDLPPETELRVSWYYLGKGGERAGVEKKLFYVRPKVVEGDGISVFDAPSRGKIWPTGRYMARVERDSKPVGTVSFEVFSKLEVDTWLYRGQRPQKEAGVGPPWKKNKDPVFDGASDAVALRVDIANPKPETKMRVMWHRVKQDGDAEFYSESDEIVLRGSKRLYFSLPKVKGGYCPGRYRVTVRLDGKGRVKREFRVTTTTQQTGTPRPNPPTGGVLGGEPTKAKRGSRTPAGG